MSDSDSELQSRGELPASVENTSEITVAGLMGVNTVADGEQPRPAQQKGYSTGGKSWLLLSSLATLSSFVVCIRHCRRYDIVVKIRKNVVYFLFFK